MKTKFLLLIALVVTFALFAASCELILPPAGGYPSGNIPGISDNDPTDDSNDKNDDINNDDVSDECKHTFGAWVTILEPTYANEGIEQRTCLKCYDTEVRKTSALPSPYNTDSDKYKNYDGLLITELEYFSNGMTVLSVYDNKYSTSISLVARNDSDKLINSWQLSYTTYSADGTVRTTTSTTVSHVAPGESVLLTFVIDSYTAKLRLGDATVKYSTDAYIAPETVMTDGVAHNKLPYIDNGITVTSFTKSGYYANAVLRNDTGKALDYVSITVYAYNAEGIRIYQSYISASAVAPGATVSDDFGIGSNESAFLFGEVTYTVDEDYDDTKIETEVNSFGITTNKLPYTLDGITIVEMVAKSNYYATFVIRNDSGKVLSKTSSIISELFDSDDVKFDTKYSSPHNLNPGESCYLDVRINDKVNSIIFTQILFRETDAFVSGETTTVNGICTNVIPFTTNGLQITSIKFDNDSYATVTVKNVSNTAFTNYSYFPCKIYDSKNVITNSGNLYITHLDPGQSCELSVYLAADDPSALKFGEAVVVEGDMYPKTDMVVIDGVSINAYPYTSNGLSAISYEFTNSTCIKVIFRNDTTEQLGKNPTITYKCLDANGVVVKEGEIYLNRTFPGETESRNLIITDDTVTVLLGEYTYT